MKDKKEFKQIFLDHWESFKQMYPAYDDEYYEESIQKMLGCGDDSNGYTEYICAFCGSDKRRIAFSCKSGFCLSCGKVYGDKVVSQVSKTLHVGVSYRHIVLTVPEQLREIFYQRRKQRELYSLLLKTAYECLEDVVNTATRKRQLVIGATIVLHTHGRSGTYNPHAHVIMTNGGIDTEEEKWVELGYFPYSLIHKKWQYHLLTMVKGFVGEKIGGLIDMLWKKYPKGFVGHVGKGEAPTSSQGLAKYLAKYVASPPISLKRILNYDGKSVTYRYEDHKSEQQKIETVPAETFIGRMVQHIFPKGFQRIRYYGLQATKTFVKWRDKIKEGLKKIGQVVKDVYQIIAFKNYRNRYLTASGKDPFLCRRCGNEMELWKIWHPARGFLYDLEPMNSS
jgi:hypothetical protein